MGYDVSVESKTSLSHRQKTTGIFRDIDRHLLLSPKQNLENATPRSHIEHVVDRQLYRFSAQVSPALLLWNAGGAEMRIHMKSKV